MPKLDSPYATRAGILAYATTMFQVVASECERSGLKLEGRPVNKGPGTFLIVR
jgi:hypothetical protein